MKKTKSRLAMKESKGKVPVELVPAQFIIDVAAVLQHGAKKYEQYDWAKGLPWSQTYGSALRHLLLWYRGEDIDKESGLNHLAHAACNILFLMTWSRTHKELDERKKL
jgi:hypothetical protein